MSTSSSCSISSLSFLSILMSKYNESCAHPYLLYYRSEVGGVDQFLGRRLLAGERSLIYA